jgi:hypothetical protein
MTGPSPESDENLYVQQETYDRLIAQERVALYPIAGSLRPGFGPNDHRYPDRPVSISSDITPNAVHRRRWEREQGRYIFEYIGDV